MSGLKWTMLNPRDGDNFHLYSAQAGWTFDIYKVDETDIPYHLKVSFQDNTIDISWFSDLDDAQRFAARKNDLAIRILMEIFK